MNVLVVEDDRSSRRALAERIRALGHPVETATSTEDAVDRLEIGEFDAIFSELQTPRIDGTRLLRIARSRRPDVRFFLVTARRSMSWAQAAEASGLLHRPFRTGRIAQLLRPARAESGTGSPPGVPRPVIDLERPITLARSDYTAPVDLGAAILGGGVSPTLPRGSRTQSQLEIDVQGASPNLVGRLLVGSYITGQDRVCLTGGRGLTRAQRSAVHRTADRILGMSVVEDTAARLEVQNFVDPSRYELPRLVNRVVKILQSELIVCRRLVADVEGPPVGSLEELEEEVDRLYLLMVRQLLLSSDSPSLARQVNVTSHHYQIGYRLVAKVLEVTGDLIFGIGHELSACREELRQAPPWVRKGLHARLAAFEDTLIRTMDAFAAVSAWGANRMLDQIGQSRPSADGPNGFSLDRRIRNRQLAMASQRVLWNVSMMTEMMGIINEVTINRCVEPERVTPLGSRLSAVEPDSGGSSRGRRTPPRRRTVRPRPTPRATRVREEQR